jgi:two-component system, sensor histidine kinase PdtaS
VTMMAGEVSAAEVRVTPRIIGKFGQLPSAVATPMAMVLTELLQNALQHGFTSSTTRGSESLEVTVVRSEEGLTVTVADNGVGVPPDFDPETSTSLGLQIVRTLVITELGGRLSITPRPGGGTLVEVDLPLPLRGV